MGEISIPSGELALRIGRLQHELQQHHIAAAIIIQRADLFYFSGTGQNAHLFIPAAGEAVLMVRKNMERARRESSLANVVKMESFSQLTEITGSVLKPGDKVGLELDVLPVNLYRRYQKVLAGYELTDISTLVRRARALKTPFEIERLREAAALSEAVFGYAHDILREGMKEVELAARLESFARSRGHQGAVRMRGYNQELFYGHIMAGENAALPSFFDGPTGGGGLNPSYPQGAGWGIVERNQPVLIDFVTVLNGYMVDQTRVFTIGTLPSELCKAFDTALRIKQALLPLGRPGTAGSELYQAARLMAEKAGLEENFMGFGDKVSFIGHGVGLELDELPVLAVNVDQPLEEGMVFALEPKFVFPGQGAVGIEDTFLVGAAGLEPLTFFEERPQLP